MLVGRKSKCLSSESTEKNDMYQHSMCPFFVQEGSTSLIEFTKFKNEAMHKGNSNLHLHLSIHCFYISIRRKAYLHYFHLVTILRLALARLFSYVIFICPNRVLVYIIDRINVIIIMYIFLRDDIPNHVKQRRTLFWVSSTASCHYTKITFIKSKI